MRWVVAVCVSGVAWLAALYVMAQTEIGAIVVQVSQNHGLHVGDLVALAVAAVVTAISFGAAAALRARSRRPTDVVSGA